jgi:hypothetical protein
MADLGSVNRGVNFVGVNESVARRAQRNEVLRGMVDLLAVDVVNRMCPAIGGEDTASAADSPIAFPDALLKAMRPSGRIRRSCPSVAPSGVVLAGETTGDGGFHRGTFRRCVELVQRMQPNRLSASGRTRSATGNRHKKRAACRARLLCASGAAMPIHRVGPTQETGTPLLASGHLLLRLLGVQGGGMLAVRCVAYAATESFARRLTVVVGLTAFFAGFRFPETHVFAGTRAISLSAGEARPDFHRRAACLTRLGGACRARVRRPGARAFPHRPTFLAAEVVRPHLRWCPSDTSTAGRAVDGVGDDGRNGILIGHDLASCTEVGECRAGGVGRTARPPVASQLYPIGGR